MGCLSHRRKQAVEFKDLNWALINLADFKAKGCGPGFFYGYLWFSLLLSIAVYAVDSFTAVNLLAFNKWSSRIEPTIPFDVSKWIFSGCIIASFVNIAYEGVRATRVMKRGNVAECYMDNLAVRWESIRFGSGQGWKRFLVFTELTKSKKGAENVAFFTYFSFQSWIRVILCSGPRQVVNALTLRSVYQAKLNPTSSSVEGSIVGFFDKIKALATEDYQQAVILSGMGFTLIVWIFSALFLLIAVLFYVFFLFHWLPRADGGLTGYCVRKVNKRLTKIVTAKVNKALAKGQAKRERADKFGEMHFEQPATRPTIPFIGMDSKEDGLAEMPELSRIGSQSTLPVYSPRPGTPNSIQLSNLRSQQRGLHSRSGTSGSGSDSSFSARAPLVGAAAHMGYTSNGYPEADFGAFPPQRPGTSNSQASFSSRSNHGMAPPLGRPFEAYNPEGRSSPAPSMASHRTGQPSPWGHPAPQSAHMPHPLRNMTGPSPMRGPQVYPQRNMTAPVGQGTRGPRYGYDLEGQRGPGF